MPSFETSALSKPSLSMVWHSSDPVPSLPPSPSRWTLMTAARISSQILSLISARQMEKTIPPLSRSSTRLYPPLQLSCSHFQVSLTFLYLSLSAKLSLPLSFPLLPLALSLHFAGPAKSPKYLPLFAMSRPC